MNYQISRNGQTYGPYTFEDLQRYVASGNILPSDLAKSDEMTEWVPVQAILSPGGPLPPPPEGFDTAPAWSDPAQTYVPVTSAPAGAIAISPYPDAPNLHWGLVLLFSILSCSLFIWVWNLIIAAWLKRVQPNATSLLYYAGALILLVLQVILGVPSSMHHAFSPGIHTSYNSIGSLVGLAAWVVRLIARFSQRASLEEHYNTVEPIGLQLNPVLVFFFGGIYFQYKLNEINMMKQAARYGSGRAL